MDCKGRLLRCPQPQADDQVARKTRDANRVRSESVVHWKVGRRFVGRLCLGGYGQSATRPTDLHGVADNLGPALIQQIDKDRVPASRLGFVLPTRCNQSPVALTGPDACRLDAHVQ